MPRRTLTAIAVTLGLLLIITGLFDLRADAQTVITAEEAYELSQSGEILLIDVRSRQEWADTGLAQGALPISIHEGDFLPKLERAVEGDFSTPIAFICASGGRSNQISTMLARQGLPNIYDVSEGMVGRLGAGKGWIEDALPVVSMHVAIEAGGLEAADDQSAEASADEDASQ